MSSSDDESIGSHANYETISSGEESDSAMRQPRRLPKRSTRGYRSQQLVGEEAEADKAFWDQDAFGDDDDENYVYKEQRDIVDSDIDLSEGEEETGEVEVEKEKKKRSSRAYREPVIRKKRARTNAGARSAGARAKRTRLTVLPGQAMGRQSLRKSTQKKSALATEERAKMQKQADKIRRERTKLTNVSEVVETTQEEALFEAVATEMENRRYMRMMLNREAMKKKAPSSRKVAQGPMIRFHSKKGQPNTISFSDHFVEVPKVINCPSTVYTKRPTRCVITGRVARYKDPLTGKPFADLAAFKILRERHKNNGKGENEEDSDEDSELSIFDLVSGSASASATPMVLSARTTPQVY
eukprot:g3099.t1